LINHYYDSKNFSLYKNGNTLRVRQKNSNLLLEYKRKQSENKEPRVCKEFSKVITHLPDFISNTQMPELELECKSISFKYLGSLITERASFEIDNIKIAFDKNYYFGNLDYEIEIEISKHLNAEKLEQLLSVKELKRNFRSKYTRFLEKYISMKSL
jgi:uncharacterized protein YjbK